MSAPSLHIESTDSMIHIHVVIIILKKSCNVASLAEATLSHRGIQGCKGALLLLGYSTNSSPSSFTSSSFASTMP